ncbi:THUMP-like domain-containing protein [Corynebacterium pelargi]|uniref:THUMP-like domain-containing protein n=1 Tax=Corynebacterium pelargi TaxID=1471400 RepID=A0A410W9C8_9CORY|nr:SAM-dependent methyltransferase [Corynebacterium pelargi]QAU52563.1 hypothetical protein CPELA_06500 [Corynebacterium pelargi]GGG77342.1 hypothetical protein GCM10007338_13920 [Corynebacterium pelargi]
MALSIEEVRYLRTHFQRVQAALEALGPQHKKDQMRQATELRQQFGDAGRAVMELASARAKSNLPHTWLVDQDSAQQATHPLVAAQRAKRIANAMPGATVADVTCSIGAELAALSAEGLRAIGSDIDPARLAMAQHNVPGTALLQADALAPAVRADVMIADPARRSAGRRIWKPEDLQPPLPTLLDTWQHTPCAIKCAPGLQYSFWEGGVSVISVDGGVKELCLYSPALLQGREAVVISSTGAMDTLYSDMPDDVDISEPRRYIIDPDGAIVRAGLVRHYAHRESLSMLDPHIAYLTGDSIPEGTSGFPFIETVGLKQLKAKLKAYDCGSLEILVRGVDVDPDRLRKQLKLRGSKPMAVVIARIGDGACAMICHPRQHRAVA